MGAYNNLAAEQHQMRGAFSVQCPENVELRPDSPAANQRGNPSTTHTTFAESVPTVKPWPKTWPPPTRTPRPTHISTGEPEHSSAASNTTSLRPAPRGVKGLRSHPRGSQRDLYTILNLDF